MDLDGDQMGRLQVVSLAQGSRAWVGEVLERVEMIKAIMLEAVLVDPSEEVVPLTEALRRPSLLSFSPRRRACSCSNIIITKSKVHGEQAL